MLLSAFIPDIPLYGYTQNPICLPEEALEVIRFVRVWLSECIRERYTEQQKRAAIDPNYFISQDVLFISKPCSVLCSLMREFHTSANRIIFKADMLNLHFLYNQIEYLQNRETGFEYLGNPDELCYRKSNE